MLSISRPSVNILFITPDFGIVLKPGCVIKLCFSRVLRQLHSFGQLTPGFNPLLTWHIPLSDDLYDCFSTTEAAWRVWTLGLWLYSTTESTYLRPSPTSHWPTRSATTSAHRYVCWHKHVSVTTQNFKN